MAARSHHPNPIDTGPEKTVPLAGAARLIRHLWRKHPGLFAWIYAIQAGEGGPIKIGVTTGEPRERLATLQQGNHEQFRGLAAWRALKIEEKQLHEEFAEARIRGEWFRPMPALVELVLALGGCFDDWTPAPEEAM